MFRLLVMVMDLKNIQLISLSKQNSATQNHFFLIRQFFLKYLKFDFASFEQGIRCYFLLQKLKGFDVVQLINERPIQTSFWLEKYLLKKIISQNKKMFLLSSGVDYLSVKFLLERKIEKSILNPYFENPKAKNEYG